MRAEKEVKTAFNIDKAKPDPLMVMIMREMEEKIKHGNMIHRKKREMQARAL